jgi:hypothetical protein
MRGYRVMVPDDCGAAKSAELHRQALEQTQLACEAQIQPAAAIDFQALRGA